MGTLRVLNLTAHLSGIKGSFCYSSTFGMRSDPFLNSNLPSLLPKISHSSIMGKAVQIQINYTESIN